MDPKRPHSWSVSSLPSRARSSAFALSANLIKALGALTSGFMRELNCATIRAKSSEERSGRISESLPAQRSTVCAPGQSLARDTALNSCQDLCSLCSMARERGVSTSAMCSWGATLQRPSSSLAPAIFPSASRAWTFGQSWSASAGRLSLLSWLYARDSSSSGSASMPPSAKSLLFRSLKPSCVVQSSLHFSSDSLGPSG
mmetsp:Transcript_92992/g.277585  ORF Transcript_92992/g.277585 Transcript_92992/m.277585 type:complete len:200 (+) Transcript_92992:1999-2598(+)